jgi:hypothetical protein
MTTNSSLTVRARSVLKTDSRARQRLPSGLFRPVLGPVIQSRSLVVLLAAMAIVQVVLTAAGTIAWQCPVKSTLGVICPGCGLTRAMILFAQGNWKAAIDLHAFAPLFWGVGILLVVGSILPTRLRQKLASRVAAVERLTGITGVIVFSVLVYWILRLFNKV